MYPCVCCGEKTLPIPPKDAVAFICPVCWWENDVFTHGDDEPSDENHGLTLNQGRNNYRLHGISYPKLREYWAARKADDGQVTISAGKQPEKIICLPEKNG